jgi:hypothetical protein
VVAPTPHDKRVWHFHKVMGWQQRKIADEVGISQTTVNRIIHRLEEEPPTEEDMAAFVASPSTPPFGFPAFNGGASRRIVLAGPIWYALAACAVLLAVSVAAVLVAAAVSLLSHQKGDPGARGPAGPAGKAATRAPDWICVAADPATGHLTKITVRTDRKCPSGNAVKIP